MKHIRVWLIDDKGEGNKLRTLVTSSAKKTVSSQMKPSLVSQCLTRPFEKSRVFCHVENEYQNIFSWRLRFSIIMELICLGKEDLDSVAHCFGKVSIETCKKFYV